MEAIQQFEDEFDFTAKEDFYNEDQIAYSLEGDEISAAEEGFMLGYLEE